MITDKLKNGAIAVIGCSGANCTERVQSELEKVPSESIIGYDIVAPAKPLPFPFVPVEDNAELARRLQEQRPRAVLIETPDFCHHNHIKIALASRPQLIVCEKPLGATLAEANQVLALCRQVQPHQQVAILDHYRGLAAVQLFSHAQRWLGPITDIEVALLEDKEVFPVSSHAAGMSNFFHHGPAVAALICDSRGLVVLKAAKANYQGSPVPDTFRAATFARPFPHPMTIRVAVGKRIANRRRQITVTGTDGFAVLDRDTQELCVVRKDGWGLMLKTSPDTGYHGVARCLATGKLMPWFLSPEKALHCLRLVEEAHAVAVELDEYPDGSELVFGPIRRAA